MELTKVEEEELKIALRNRIEQLEGDIRFQFVCSGADSIVIKFDRLKSLKGLFNKIKNH